MTTQGEKRPLFDPAIMRQALIDAVKKLHPWHQVRNPVMFVVLVGSVLTTGLFIQALVGHGEAPASFIFAVSLWLWFTVLFANFAEAMAEGRGKAQADALRRGCLYIQINSEKAPPGYSWGPKGTLWGWLLPKHAVAGQNVPQAGHWFIPQLDTPSR